MAMSTHVLGPSRRNKPPGRRLPYRLQTQTPLAVGCLAMTSPAPRDLGALGDLNTPKRVHFACLCLSSALLRAKTAFLHQIQHKRIVTCGTMTVNCLVQSLSSTEAKRQGSTVVTSGTSRDFTTRIEGRRTSSW